MKSTNKASINKESANKASNNKQAINQEPINKQAINKANIDSASGDSFNQNFSGQDNAKGGQEPLFHIVQRAALPTGRAMLYRLLAVMAALLTGGIFLTILGFPAPQVYGTMFSGSFGSIISLREMIKFAIPLCITALGITLAFKMRFWNIGAEGQICIGAIAGSYFGYFHADWPQYILIPVMLLAGFIAAGLWGMIPAYFKTKFGTNETLFTLMMNYIAVYIIQLLREGSWKDPKSMGFPIMPRFAKSAVMPTVLGIHMGWIVAIALAALIFIYLRHTKQGYELTVAGENMNTARYAGMPVKKIILRTMFLSAGICGLSGILQASGADKMLTDTVAGGVGFTAIIVAWLARLSPIGIIITSILFGMMRKGFGTAQSIYNLSSSVSEVLQGIILFFVLGAEFFLTYKIVFRSASKESSTKLNIKANIKPNTKPNTKGEAKA